MTTWVLEHVACQTAGSPTDETVKWTHLRPCDIAAHLKKEHKITVSHGCIKRILKKDGYVKRKPIKCIATGSTSHRSEQFRMVL